MTTIIISAKDNAELELLSSLFEKMKIKNKILTEEEKEGLGLVALMKKADRSKKVSNSKVIQKLTT